MENNAEQYKYVLYGNFWQILDFTKKIVNDFEKIIHSGEFRKSLPTIEDAYTHLIFINFSKIFSESRNETFSSNKFKNILKKELANDIESIKNNHREIISKMKNNRDNFGSHLGKNFTELLFSESEVKIKENAYKTDFSKLKAKSKDQERYTPQDLANDLPEIKTVLNKLDAFWEKILPAITN